MHSQSENSWGGMTANYELYTEIQRDAQQIRVTEGTRLVDSYPAAEDGWERQFTVDRATGAITSLDPFADNWFSAR